MKTILFIILMLSFVLTACINNRTEERYSKPIRNEFGVANVKHRKNVNASKKSTNDTIFLKRIIDGSFFDEKKSHRQDYVMVINHCLSHTDEQYDEVFADGLCHMLQKYPQKIKGLQTAMDILSPIQRKIANDNMIAYIVSSWMMEKNTDSINLDKFYQTFPFFKNKPGVDSIFIEQWKNYEN